MKDILSHVRHNKSIWLVAIAAFVILFQGIYCFAKCGSSRTIVASIVFAVFVVGIYVLHTLTNKKSERAACHVFLVALCFLGLTYMLIFTPGTIPDERYHFLEAYSLSNSLLLIPQSDGGLMMRADDIAFITNGSVHNDHLRESNYDSILENFALFCNNPELTFSESAFAFDLGSNPPQDRLASALGISLARILGLGSIPLYYLGRLFNLASFVAMSYVAIRIIPIGRKAVMAVALLPMTLHLVASYSYDAFIIGASLLFSALALKAIRCEGCVSRKNVTAMCIVIFLLAPCKMVYTLLVILAFAIPAKNFETRKRAITSKALIVGSAILGIAVLKVNVILNMLGIASANTAFGVYAFNPYGNQDFRGIDTGDVGYFYDLSDILGDPLRSAFIFLRTLDSMGDMYIQTIWGGSLGWLQPGAPDYMMLLFIALVAMSCVRSKDDDIIIPGRRRLLYASIFAAGVAAILLAMMLGWTFDTEEIIQGIQGRYFLPLLLMLCLALRLRSVTCDLDLSFWCPFAFSAANSFYMIWIIAAAVLE